MNILWLARHGLNEFEQIAIIGVVVVAIISLLYAWYLRGRVMAKDKGTAKMQEVWNAIRIGANSYLNRQLRSILPLILILTVALFLSVYIVPPSLEAREWHCIFIQGVDAHNIDALTTCAEGITKAGYSTSLPANLAHHWCGPHDCFYHGCILLADGRSARDAHGDPGKCSCCFCCTAWFQ